MTLTISQNATAIGPFNSASFAAQGGTSPYVFSVLPGGAGGTIGVGNGVYTAPSVMGTTPLTLYDTIQVTDAAAGVATARILVGSPLLLFCEIIQRGMGLADGRVYLWDQKIFQPTDSDIYVAVSVPRLKPFGNTNANAPTGPGFDSNQFLACLATLDIDIISRGPAARDRKEEVLLALNSNYSRYQQDANAFSIGQLSSSFANLSHVDGAAIPYRYKISVNLTYSYQKTSAVPYFNTFAPASVTTEA